MALFRGSAMTFFITWIYMAIASTKVFALEATMGLYANDNERINILEESVFIGKEDNNVSELWCHGDNTWDICSWLWKDKITNNCQYIEGITVNTVKVCTDDFMNIDRKENDCTLKFFSGFSKANHEGPWECRLSK